MPALRRISIATIVPTMATPRSSAHHETAEMIYVVDGDYAVELKGEEWLGEPGDIFYYPPQTRHRPHPPEDLTSRILGVQWVGGSDDILWKRAFRVHDSRGRVLSALSWMSDPLIPSHRAKNLRRSLLAAALMEIEDLVTSPGISNDPVHEIMRLITASPEHPFTLNSLARHVGWTAHRLIRRFKAAYGSTPMKYLQKLRLELALRLLQTTTSPLREIAERVGYRSAFHLSSEIKREYGRPPRDLRGAGSTSYTAPP